MPRRVIVILLSLIYLAPALRAQETGGPAPADTFADGEARRLVLSVVNSRARAVEAGGLDALLTARERVGILVPNQWMWRFRTLYHKETAALLALNPEGPNRTLILGRHRGAPVIGDRVIDRPAILWGRVGFDPESESTALLGVLGLALQGVGPELPLERSDDSVVLFDTAFVSPLTPEGLDTYRYALGDTVKILRPARDERITVEFRSRSEKDVEVVGAIWFDPETEQPVRASLRPRGNWRLQAGLSGFISRVPFTPRFAYGTVDHVVFDYDQERTGVPVRIRVNGTMHWFFNQVRMPVDVEYLANWDEGFKDPPRPPDPDDPTSLVPPPLGGGWRLSEVRGELNPYLRSLDKVTGAPPWPGVGHTLAAVAGDVRFNQVMGLSVGVPYPMPVGARSTLTIHPRFGTTSFEPTGEVIFTQQLKPWGWGVQAYSKLRDANYTENAYSTWNSIMALVFGQDDGNYFLARGASLFGSFDNRPVDALVEIFSEHHFDAPRLTDYSFFRPPEENRPSPIEAEEGTLYGFRGHTRVQLGDDAQRGVFIGRATFTAAWGDFRYQSIGLVLDGVGPLFWRLAGAVRGSFGLAWGDVPNQGLYYLGGTKTIRGFPANSASGESLFSLRSEIGSDLPLIRAVLFSDVAWTNELGSLFDGDPLAALGVGVSVFDGMLRLDMAKGITSGGIWRFHLDSSGLF